MELDVLLKVSTQLVTVQVIAEGEALARDQHVYLIPHRHRKEGLQAICQGYKWGGSTSAQACATLIPHFSNNGHASCCQEGSNSGQQFCPETTE
jgi:hypothetical protein